MIFNKLAFSNQVGLVACPYCKQELQTNYKNRYCWCSSCRKKLRATSWRGSVLYGCKLSPRQLFILLWCFQMRKSPDTARLLSRVSYTTVSRWYKRFRLQLPEGTIELSDVVQVDESYFGKQKSQQEQVIVTGGIEADTRRVSLAITNSRHRDVLQGFVEQSIKPGSLVVTDAWYGYNELTSLGYDHEEWNHSRGRLAGTNQIEGLWSIIKRHLRKLYGCIPTTNLEMILKEWTNRHNNPHLFENPETYLKECVFRVS